ncbi:MAG: AsmA-like C-terminal region-containing protein, partial [Hyphomicrobiaceae bacterium]
KGRVDVAAPSLETFARWLDFPLPDGFAGTATAAGDVEAGTGRIALSNVRLTHVGQSASGSLAIDMTGDRPRISGRLEADKLDVDRYAGLAAPKRAVTRNAGDGRAPVAGIPANQVIKAYLESLLAQPVARGAGRLKTDAEFSLEAPARTTTGKLSNIEWDATPIKFAALNTFDLDLDVAVRTLSLRGLDVGVPLLKAKLSEGKLELEGNELALRGGQMGATVIVDARQPMPSVAARVKGTGIDVSRVLEAFGFDPVLAGASSIEADITSLGTSERELVEGLSGRVQAKMGSGRIVGYDLTTPWGLAAAGNFDPSRSMDITGITAAMTIENGVTRDTKAELTGPKISADGSGVIRLVPQEMDYKANVKLNWLSSILVNVFGDWSSLQWKYSLGGFLLGGGNGSTSPDLVPSDIFGDPALARLADQVLTRAGKGGLEPGLERFVREVKTYASSPAPAR